MLYQALARLSGQGVTFVNGYSLFTCYNTEMAFELVPRRASQIALTFVVINYQCRINIKELRLFVIQAQED